MAEYTTQSNPWANRQKSEAEKQAAMGEQRKSWERQEAELKNKKAQALANLPPGKTPDEVASEFDQQIVQIQTALRNSDMQGRGLNPDGSAMRPEFMSLIDQDTGLLYEPYQLKIDQYNAKTVDPSQLQDYQAFRKEATREGPSKWATMMQEVLGQKRASDIEKAARQSAGADAQARGQLAMRGGLSSGSRERLASQGMSNLLGAKQQVGRDYNMQNLQLLSDDEKNRMAMFNQLPGMETGLAQFNTNILNQMDKGNIEAQARAREFNIQNALTEKAAGESQNLDVYKEQQKKWAAEKQSQATANSGGGGGGCCFIFLEARYGDGTMDEVVRKYRDEHMTERNVRGYYKMSEVLVPLMRKSRAIKLMVRLFMTDPMVSYGKYYYGKNKHGWIFKPVVEFWLGTFNYLGLEHQYVRENGEVV